MSGWRDSDGRTAADRRKLEDARERASFIDTLKRRPLTLLRGWTGAIFIFILVLALLLAFR